MVKEKGDRKTLNRQIEEGVYNIKQSDYESENGNSKLKPQVVVAVTADDN